MGVYIPNIEKPKRCDDCWALDDKYDYPMCLITQEQRGYNFNTMTQIMDKCPLIEIEEWNSYGHGKMYAPKGTFQKILDDCEEDES